MSVEKGAAGINLELKNGQIFVRHSEGNFLLAHWITEAGDWDKIWNTINRMVKKTTASERVEKIYQMKQQET